MKHQDSFFRMRFLSKLTFIIPIIVVIAAVGLRLQQQMVSNRISKISPTPTLVITTPTIESPSSVETTPKAVSPTSGIKLDLNGPFSCHYNDKFGSVTAYIKNKNIYVQTKQVHSENMLLNGDCAYKWEPTQKTGEKTCGMATYVDLFETLSGMGMVDMATIFNMIPTTTVMKKEDRDAFAQHVLDSCKKVPVNDSVFAVPRAVDFIEKQSGGASLFGQ